MLFSGSSSHFQNIEMHPWPWEQHVPFPLFFFWFFPYFIAIFLFVQPHFLYLKICTWPWKQHPPSSIFFIFFSYFIAIWKCALDPDKAPPMLTSTVSTTLYLFLKIFPILSLFFIWKSIHFHIWKCTFGPWKQWAPRLAWGGGGQQQALYSLGGSWQLTGRPAS